MTNRVLARMRRFTVEDLSRHGNVFTSWGRIARDWQVADVEALLDEDTPAWCWQLRPRGSSKTQDAGLLALSCLLTIQPPFSTTHIFARDEDQAAILFRKIAHETGSIANLTVTGRRITNTDTGAEIVVEGADAASSLGATPWLVICDEVCGWPSTPNHLNLWANILSGMGKRPDARLLVITSAGDPATPFAAAFRAAQAAPEDWIVSVLPGPPPFMSEAVVERARRNLPESIFQWHYLNQFAAPDNALMTKEEVEAAFASAPTSRPYDPEQRYIVTADLSETNDATVLLVSHMEQGDLLVVDHMTRIKPSRLRPIKFPDVKRRIMNLSDGYGNAPIRMDKSRGEQMLQEMREDGYLVEAYNFAGDGNHQLTLALQRVVRERGLRALDDKDMREELASVFVQATGDKVKIEHHSGKHNDITICLAMAAHHWLSQPFRGARRPLTSNTEFHETPPRIQRDTSTPSRTGVAGPSRAFVSREDHARRTLDRLIRLRRGT